MKRLYEFLISTVSEKEALNAQKNGKYIYSSAVDKLENCDYDGNVGRYSFTKDLLIDYLESQENVGCKKERAEMDDWLS